MTTKAMVHSVNDIREVIIVGKIENTYLAIYEGQLCTAIFNVFTGLYYVDNIYGVIGSITGGDHA